MGNRLQQIGPGESLQHTSLINNWCRKAQVTGGGGASGQGIPGGIIEQTK